MGLVAVVALLLVGLLAAGVRVPGVSLARAVASRILCAATFADNCGDEPALIAAYGAEIGKLVREHMPSIAFESGSRALPVDFRRCRSSACGDGSARGLVHRADSGLPVTAFVHVIDCREAEDSSEVDESTGEDVDGEAAIGEGGEDVGDGEAGLGNGGDPDCSGPRAGNLYLQYWTYYADSATLRGVPIAGRAGFHRDDWEGVQIRIGRDGRIDERVSSHGGYNHDRGVANWGSDAGIDALKDVAEAVGARSRNGWGPETRLLLVSGGSHAGNAIGFPHVDRLVPGRRVHLVPLESVAAENDAAYRFAVSPPWRKRVWRDPEAAGTD